MQSDDLMDPDYLQLVSQVFDEQPNVGFLAASCRYIDADDNVIWPGTQASPRLYAAGDEAVTAFLTQFVPHVSSIVMRRMCYEEVGKFDEAIWHGPDMEMDVRLAARFNFYHVGGIHTSFRRHGSNMGNLEYLRDDFLEVDLFKERKIWEYLSPQGRRQLDVGDLDKYLAQDAASTALNGAIVTLAYGRSRLSRHYLRQAIKFNNRMWFSHRWWMAAVLVLMPPLGKQIIGRRMRLGSTDRVIARETETSLKAIDRA